MGFNFRKKIKLGKFISLNFGKRGVTSMSIGRPGFTFNINGSGVKTTVGAPGTGISYSTQRRNVKVKTYEDNQLKPFYHNFFCSCKEYFESKLFFTQAIMIGVLIVFLGLGFFVTHIVPQYSGQNNKPLFPLFLFVLVMGVALLSIFFAFLKLCENLNASAVEAHDFDLYRARLQNKWGQFTAQDIVDFVNVRYGCVFTENNLVSGNVSNDPEYFDITMWCGGQTIKTQHGFIRNKNINLQIHIHDILYFQKVTQ